MKAEPLDIRFWRKVEKSEGCWLWMGARSDGYGHIAVRYPKRTDVLAHRVAWMFTFGPIPAGKQVLHRCDVRNCVRPDHLFLGDNAANVADRVRKGRSGGAKGESNVKAKLTAEQVAEIRAAYVPAPIGHPRKGEPRRSIPTLAERYGVSESQIYHIVRGWNWKD